jgi:UDP-N-acetylglucosamine acyltransferase
VLKGKYKLIDPSAKIDPSAEIARDVSIGPWSIIGPNVNIGAGSEIASHVVIRANTRIGKNNKIFQFSSVGEEPADKKFAGEETWMEIGDNNILRESVSLHRGTEAGGAVTRIGSNNLLMPHVHVAHDCRVGDNVVFANYAAISGHVEVDDWVILGGFSGVKQFVKVGAHAMVGAMTYIHNDVPAYVIVSGQPAAVRSINTIGLERRGFEQETISQLRTAFKIIYKRNLGLKEAIVQIVEIGGNSDALKLLIDSLESSEQGIVR